MLLTAATIYLWLPTPFLHHRHVCIDNVSLGRYYYGASIPTLQDGRTALMEAADQGHTDVVKVLVAIAGVELNVVDKVK